MRKERDTAENIGRPDLRQPSSADSSRLMETVGAACAACARRIMKLTSPDAFTIMLAAAIGCATGFMAFVLKAIMARLTHWLLTPLSHGAWHWQLLLLPVAAIVLSMLFSRYIARAEMSHGVARISSDLTHHRYRLPGRLTVMPVFASGLTLGLGGSAGAEGPIAYTGAAIGSNMARICGLTPDQLRLMIGCGAGAGIAGIFKSPVGGALFTLEVLRMQMTTITVLALIVSALCSAGVCYILTGFTPNVSFMQGAAFSPADTAWIVLLGIFCGLYSIYYTKIKEITKNLFSRRSNRWLKALAGGLTVGILVSIFPSLYGEGYSTLTDMVNNSASGLPAGSPFAMLKPSETTLLILAAGILLVRSAAMAATNCSGGVGGDFAPSLFSGAVAGWLFAEIVNITTGASLPAGNFALMGMAGVMAGTVHAPLMAIFLTVEMTGAYTFLPGAFTTAFTAYIAVKLLSPRSRYDEAHHDDIDALIGKTTK